MKDETSDMDDMLQREEVRKALWNAVLPATRQVDPVLWDSVVKVVEERIIEYLRNCPRQQANIEDFETNIVFEKEGPPASLDQVIKYLLERKELVPVGVFQLKNVAICDNSTNVTSFLASAFKYPFELLKQTCRPLLESWTGWGDNEACFPVTHKCLIEELIERIWSYVEEHKETHNGGRFLVQELCSVFSGDDVLCHRALYVLVQQEKAVVYEIEKDVFGVKFGPDLSMKAFDKNIFSMMHQISRLEKHIDNLNQKLSEMEERLKVCAEKLRKYKSSQNELYMIERKKASQLLNICKYLENSISRSYQQLNNLNELLYSSEAAEFSRQATQALQVGRDGLLLLNKDQNEKEIDDIMLDLQEHIENQREIDEILSSPILSSSEDLEEDLNRLEASLDSSPAKEKEDSQKRGSVKVEDTLSSRKNVEKQRVPNYAAVPLHSS
ncbi:hypothetical protein GAYE_SCF66G6868 [Galdieria yellowstonensis]|uniref:Charged multivesicular body protein 7 n=1 Tax=Galdieria yellowstonensis TaxID=3028027 RepID=A0AAV9INC2_9RHOD|nr:hypothetical protein GAYE_SCF66G6868 [Galdieria yellowstonensis]